MKQPNIQQEQLGKLEVFNTLHKRIILTVKALGHHVLVSVPKPEEVTQGGIVIPSQARDREQRGAELGIVIDVGPTAWMADGLGGERWAEVGDKVWFAKYAGKWIKDEKTDEEVLILLDTDIVAKKIED